MSWKKGAELRYIYQTCSCVRLYTKIQPQSKHGCLSSWSSLDHRRPTVTLLPMKNNWPNCGNKMPTRCNRGFCCRSYCLLNMFRASLCPSSGAQEYYTVVAACGILCCGFSSNWSGVELRVMRPVCRMLVYWLVGYWLVGILFPHINDDARSK